MIIIKTLKYKPNGLFANIIIQIVGYLSGLEKLNIYPFFDIKSNLYGISPNFNIFDNYLLLNYNYQNNNNFNFDILEINKYVKTTTDNDNIIIYEEDIRKSKLNYIINCIEANRIFFKYFKFPESIIHDVSLFIKPYENKNILGLHYRGTDKMQTEFGKGYSEASYFSFDNLIKILNNFIKIRNVDVLFIATDNPNIIQKIKNNIDIPIINFYLNFNIDNDKSFHNKKFSNEKEKKEMGLSALRDTLMLSKCTYVLKYCSQMSAFAKIINPDLEIYRLNKPNYSWFPENTIPEISNKYL